MKHMGNYYCIELCCGCINVIRWSGFLFFLSVFSHLLLFPCLSSCRLALSTFPRMNTNSSDEFFQATNHAEQTFRKMETYLQHKQLCDVLLIAGDHKIPAHRLVFVLHLALITSITSTSIYSRETDAHLDSLHSAVGVCIQAVIWTSGPSIRIIIIEFYRWKERFIRV